MRSSMFLASVLMLLASTTLLASGRGKGGGQGHASTPHAAGSLRTHAPSPPRAHMSAATRSEHAAAAHSHAATPSAAQAAKTSPTHQSQAVVPGQAGTSSKAAQSGNSATQARAQGLAGTTPTTAQTPAVSGTTAGTVQTPGLSGTRGFAAQAPAQNGTSTSATQAPAAQSPVASTATPAASLAATAPATTPLMMYGSLLPFGAQAGLALNQGYRAHNNYYGSRAGYRGYGYRNTSMVSNRMRRLAKLVRDLNTLTVGYSAPVNDRNILRNDLMAVAQGGMRPPSAAVNQLSQHLVNYLPQRRTPLLNTERLALNLETVMNGGRLNSSQVNRAISSSQSILRSSGLPQPGLQDLNTAMRSVGFWGVAGNQAGLLR